MQKVHFSIDYGERICTAGTGSTLVVTFFNPCVLRAHGGSGYTFGALAILEGCHPGKNPDVHSKSRSVPIAAIRLPPGSTAVTLGAGPTPWGLCQEAG